MEAIARESNTGIPIGVGGQGESTQRRRLVAEPEITGACGKRGGYALNRLDSNDPVSHWVCHRFRKERTLSFSIAVWGCVKKS